MPYLLPIKLVHLRNYLKNKVTHYKVRNFLLPLSYLKYLLEIHKSIIMVFPNHFLIVKHHIELKSMGEIKYT